jgi:fumarate hydratase subunit beta
MKEIHLPLSGEENLVAGDAVKLTGTLYVARDQAHQRLVRLLEDGQPLPIPLAGETLYYMGPTPTPPGHVIGACGPTTAGRMDAFTPALLAGGLRGMIGKGGRSPAVVEAIKRHGALYFHAYGGCGALYAQCVKSCRVAAFEDLGPEAILQLEVENFPVVVSIDPHGTVFPAPM